MCSSHLPHIFNLCMCTMGSFHENVLLMSANVLKSLLEQCIKPNIEFYITDLKQNTDIEKSLLKKYSHQFKMVSTINIILVGYM